VTTLTQPTPAPPASGPLQAAAAWALNNSLYVALVAAFVLFSILAAPYNFLSLGNMVNILIAAATLGLITCGLTLALLAGQVDLSATGVAGLASIVAAVLFQQWAWSAPVAIGAALAVGALAGLVTSMLIVEVRIYSLIASLSVIGLFIGLAMTFSGNLQIPLARMELQEIMFYRGLLGIPLTVWVMLAFFALSYVLLNHTKLGAHIYATGANYTAARLCGVPVNRVIRITLMLSGVTVALAALLVTARSNMTVLYGAALTNPQLASGDALVAVLLGGASLFGGTGKIERNLAAVLFLVVVQNGLTLLSVPLSGWFVFKGLAFLLAVVLDVVRSRTRLAG
jgi:ribose transport system permease protein